MQMILKDYARVCYACNPSTSITGSFYVSRNDTTWRDNEISAFVKNDGKRQNSREERKFLFFFLVIVVFFSYCLLINRVLS